MAKYFNLLILSALLLLTSCQEGSDAGDLLGQWRLTNTDSEYIAFSGSVVVFRHTTPYKLENEIFGNFQHKGDSLIIHCYSIEGNPNDTTIVEKGFGFKPFTDIRVKIETLNGDRLILSKGSQTWNFDKY